MAGHPTVYAQDFDSCPRSHAHRHGVSRAGKAHCTGGGPLRYDKGLSGSIEFVKFASVKGNQFFYDGFVELGQTEEFMVS